MQRGFRLRGSGMALALWGLCCVVTPAWSGTTTTEYTYNGDGALTSMTVTQEGGTPETTYLTWDNFTPDASNPSTGTLKQGNGRLVGMGPQPGAASTFEFDVRDRLTSQGAGATAQSYGYHANSLLATSELGDQSRTFYQGSGQHPVMLNVVESGDGETRRSARLGAGRYLSDGTEQVLIDPRKDTEGVYSPADGTLSSRTYDPFGAQAEETPATEYDLADNPFQYAGEYRDPVWGGVYLRARWYDPNLAQFISRDPMPHLNPYAYGGGNPVMRVDPGGMSFIHDLAKADEWMNQGVGGHFARIFLSPAMAILAIGADPGGFWQQIKHNKAGIDIFLGAAVVVEAASIGLEGFGLSETVRTLGPRTRFGTRLLIDNGLNVGQSVAVGYDRGHGQFDWSAFVNANEMSGGWEALSRGVFGMGYHPYAMKGEDVAQMLKGMRGGMFGETTDDSVLIFRTREPYAPWKLKGTSPLAEALELGNYHERIVAIASDFSEHNELDTYPMDDGTILAEKNVMHKDGWPDDYLQRRSRMRYQYVGKMSRQDFLASGFTDLNPRELLLGGGGIDVNNNNLPVQDSWRYNRLRNNCHNHAQAVLKLLNVE